LGAVIPGPALRGRSKRVNHAIKQEDRAFSATVRLKSFDQDMRLFGWRIFPRASHVLRLMIRGRNAIINAASGSAKPTAPGRPGFAGGRFRWSWRAGCSGEGGGGFDDRDRWAALIKEAQSLRTSLLQGWGGRHDLEARASAERAYISKCKPATGAIFADGALAMQGRGTIDGMRQTRMAGQRVCWLSLGRSLLRRQRRSA
jgi:hypothetical protein